MKKLYLTIILLLAFFFSNSQIVDILDANFKNALVNTICVDSNEDGIPDINVDTNNDGEIQVSEAEAVFALYVEWSNIISLEGMQSFINIEILVCSNNQITSLDLTQNINLYALNCFENQITSLDFTYNPDLYTLICDSNQLSNLDLTQNPNLRSLYIGNNDLTTLELTQNPNLELLFCSGNQLSSLDLSNNINLRWFYVLDNQLINIDLSQNINLENIRLDSNLLMSVNLQNGNNTLIESVTTYNNTDLICIQVDDEDYSSSQECIIGTNDIYGWCVDPWTEYSEGCSFGIEDNNTINYTIFPNPVKDVLLMESQQQIESVKIYNLQGQLINVKSGSSLDVSHLSIGLYFVHVVIDGKTVTKKFVKE